MAKSWRDPWDELVTQAKTIMLAQATAAEMVGAMEGVKSPSADAQRAACALVEETGSQRMAALAEKVAPLQALLPGIPRDGDSPILAHRREEWGKLADRLDALKKQIAD